MIELIHGDCLEVLPALEIQSVDCVVTSPPYAEQRKGLYEGVPEQKYPQWTVSWMDALKPALRPQGSVLINIREHVKDGQISDYVLRTRLALRDAGWIECEELIWIKPGAPPVGNNSMPRRSWERILWFSPAPNPFCDARANGTRSNYVGFMGAVSSAAWLSSSEKSIKQGMARCRDYVEIPTACNDVTGQPATYPVTLAQWMIKLVCPDVGTVLDPFAGSGTTAVAAYKTGRNCIAIEKDAEYFKVMQRRVSDVQMQPALELTA